MIGARRGLLGRLAAAASIALSAGSTLLAITVRPSEGQAAGVSGEAYGHFSRIGLFGAEPGVVGPSPRVVLPSEGTDVPLTATDSDGVVAAFGPATVFGGRSPGNLSTPPPSGPITVSTVGRSGPGGSVTSTASITLHPTAVPFTCDGQPLTTRNCSSPGGFGPVVPNTGDELHATCTANEHGATGSVRFVNATVAKATDPNGEPLDQEPLPEHPPPNYTREGVITHVGDRWRTVYNEQIVDPDGSITVNAIHMFLLGDTAVGESILGHVRCSMRPAATSPTTALTPDPKGAHPSTAAGAPQEGEVGGDPLATPSARPATPADSGTRVLPFALGGGVVVAALAGGGLVWRRRRRADARDLAPSPGPGGD